MIRDITLGQYYPSDSVIHRLDPRIKIIATLAYIVELFVVDSFSGFAVCAAGLAVIVFLSRVPLGFIMRGLKPVILILVFTFCLNIFMMSGDVLFKIGPLTATWNGLSLAVFMTIRLILLIIGSSLLTLTTTPIRLTDAIERLLSPLKLVRVPVHDIAMMMSIALRFIPTLLEEADKIIKAQQARGADFESGNIIARARSLVPVLIPLFVSAFRIAQDLALAMEARCYRGGVGRTHLHTMKLQTRDWIAAIIMTAFLAVIIFLRVMP